MKSYKARWYNLKGSETTKREKLVQPSGGNGSAGDSVENGIPSDPMADNGLPKNGGKHNKQIILRKGASSSAPPTFRMIDLVYFRNNILLVSFFCRLH